MLSSRRTRICCLSNGYAGSWKSAHEGIAPTANVRSGDIGVAYWARTNGAFNGQLCRRKGWLYPALAIVLGPMADKGAFLDLHSRRLTGWAVSNRIKRDLAIRALNMAIALRRRPKGCIHHTDLGSHYCSHDYQKLLRQHGFQVSMGGTGNCYKFKDGLRSRSDDPGII